MNARSIKFRHLFFVAGIFLSIGGVNQIHAADRFAPIAIHAGLDVFNQRFTNNNPNIDFIVAEVLNNARQIERGGERFKQTASVITNRTQNAVNSGNRAVSNSVVVEAGVKVDTLIIINESSGDSYAIQR